MKASFIDFKNISIPAAADKNNVVQKSTVNRNDIAIIGMAGTVASAENLDEFWKLLSSGREALREPDQQRKKDYITHMEAIGEKGVAEKTSFLRYACMHDVDKFDCDFFGINPQEAEYMDPSQRMLLQSSYHALEDAGYGEKNVRGANVGLYVAYSVKQKEYQDLFEGAPDTDYGKALTGNLPAVLASRLSYLMDLKGPAIVMDTACSSGLTALHTAVQALRGGDCEMAVVGAVNYCFEPLTADAVRIGIESDDGSTKTFDDNSKGINSGEASVAIVVKQLYKAVQDRDHVYAVIKGSALNQDGASVGITAPNMDAQEKMLLSAWQNAGVNPETISYIEAHGTGTNLGDPIEVGAIKNAFEKYTQKKQFCAIGSVKSNVGHTNAAAGLVGLMKTVLAMNKRQIPATINFNVPNRKINFIDSPVYVNSKLREWNEDHIYCGVSSFGMSGTNAHFVLEEATDTNERTQDPERMILTVSAKTQEALKSLLESYIEAIQDETVSLADFAYTINTSRKTFEYRLAFVFSNRAELLEHLKQASGQTLSVQRVQIVNSVSESERIILSDGTAETISDEALQSLAAVYRRGFDMNWKLFYNGCKYHRIRTPLYPFAKKRCWIDPTKNKSFLRKFDKYCQDMLLRSDVSDELKQSLRAFTDEFSAQFNNENAVSNRAEVILSGRENGEYTETERFLAQVCYETFGYREINIHSTLEEMNADSLQIVHYFGKIREHYEVNVTEIYSYPTIYQLAAYLERNQTNVEELADSFKKMFVAMRERNSQVVKSDAFQKEAAEYQAQIAAEDSLDLSERNEFSNIFLTGATGYFGVHILQEVLEQCDAKVYALVRGNNTDAGLTRIKSRFEGFFGEGSFEPYASRIVPVIGDMEQMMLGMDEEVYNTLSNEIDCIIHCAANTNHFGDYNAFYKANVDSTEKVIAFAKAGKKKDIHYISTFNVVDLLRTEEKLFFTEYTESKDENIEMVDNYYAKTKILAECKMQQARADGLSVNMYRLGRIMFESGTGKMQNNIANNATCLILKSFLELGLVPDIPDYKIDFTYVDIAARAMVKLMLAKALNNSTLHLRNSRMNVISKLLSDAQVLGHAKMISMEEFLDKFVQAYREDLPGKELFRDILVHCFNDGDMEGIMYMTIHEETARTDKLLERMGLKWFEVTPEILNKFIVQCRKIGFMNEA